jgi:hypothetical protein
MTTLYAGNSGLLTSIDVEPLSYANSISFDLVGNEDLMADIMANADHYILAPGPDLKKDGVSVVPANTTPAVGSWRAQRAALVADQALITAATTVTDLTPILEDMRTAIIAIMDALGERW